MIASAQVGTHVSTKGPAERKTYGHSVIVDPWGNIEIELGDKETIHVHQISRDKIRKVREQIPMASHRLGRKEIHQ
jgi:predicted amidohydrolase